MRNSTNLFEIRNRETSNDHKKDCEMQIIIMFQFFIVQSIEKLINI
jgi:hypothetical protein